MSPLAHVIALIIVGTTFVVRLAVALYRAHMDGQIAARHGRLDQRER